MGPLRGPWVLAAGAVGALRLDGSWRFTLEVWDVGFVVPERVLGVEILARGFGILVWGLGSVFEGGCRCIWLNAVRP